MQFIMYISKLFLNKARADHRPLHAWFLKIDQVRIVSMCVYLCVSPPLRLLITSDVMWRDMDSIRWVKQGL